jgi:hypothetical protein
MILLLGAIASGYLFNGTRPLLNGVGWRFDLGQPQIYQVQLGIWSFFTGKTPLLDLDLVY